MKVEIEFTEPLLGTMAGDKEVATDFIANKHPDGVQKDEAEAIETLDEELEKTSTVFPREDDKPFMWDYQFKGFFKEACAAMIQTETLKKEELKKVALTNYMHKRTIDRMIFVTPRRVFLMLPDGCNGDKLPFHERPLRGQTQRGERICLARSEKAPIGTKVEIEIVCLNAKLRDFIKRWLDYGALQGMLQWRNGGFGRFKWQELK